VIRRASLVAVLLLVMSAASVSAATSTVTIQNVAYSPATSKVARGTSVVWSNQDPFQHTATSDVAGLFTTGFINGGTNSPAIVFGQAGSFAFHCQIHSSMHGTIKVKMSASPKSGTATTTFTLTLANAAVPSGYTHDLQVSRNGGAYTALPSTTNTTATYKPGRTGTYKFKTRLHQVGGATVTGWSPAATVKVS
jgi:plastocyanin